MEILRTGCGFDTATGLVKKKTKKEENFILKLCIPFTCFNSIFYIVFIF